MSETEENLSETNLDHSKYYSVQFLNTGDNSMNYYGTYTIPHSSEKEIIVFNLFSKYGPRQLHIKLYYKKVEASEDSSETKEDKEYSVGMFTTFEDNKLQSFNLGELSKLEITYKKFIAHVIAGGIIQKSFL